MQRRHQAGEYNGWTAMGDGILKARELLVGAAGDPDDDGYSRYGARPTMLVMTDGQTNQAPSGWSMPAGFNWAEWTDYDGDGTADYSTAGDIPHHSDSLSTVAARVATAPPRPITSRSIRSARPAMSSRPNRGTAMRLGRVIGGDGDDMGIVRGQRRAAEGLRAPRLDLRHGRRLVALDDDQVAGIEHRHHIAEIGLGRAGQLLDDGDPLGRHHDHLAGAGAAMAGAVRLGIVDLELVVGMLHRREAIPPPRQFGDEADRQRRLAGFLPADDGDDRRTVAAR